MNDKCDNTLILNEHTYNHNPDLFLIVITQELSVAGRLDEAAKATGTVVCSASLPTGLTYVH